MHGNYILLTKILIDILSETKAIGYNIILLQVKLAYPGFKHKLDNFNKSIN